MTRYLRPVYWVRGGMTFRLGEIPFPQCFESRSSFDGWTICRRLRLIQWVQGQGESR